MASNAFKDAFANFIHRGDDISKLLQKVAVVVIDMNVETSAWRKSEFWQALHQEKIDISVLPNPCKVDKRATNRNGSPRIAEAELRLCCTPEFWEAVHGERIGLAMSVTRGPCSMA